VDLADVNGDGLLDIASGWEQGGAVTVSINPGSGDTAEWPMVVLPAKLYGVEDAIFDDVDDDGHLDVVTACECRKVVIFFGPEADQIMDPGAWTVVQLPAPAQRWLKVAIADLDNDGRRDVLGGGKVSPATVGWFRAPDDPRNGAAWTYTPISEVAWTMSLIPMDVDGDDDVDVVLSDRHPIHKPDGSRRYDLRGSRWLENPMSGGVWTNNPIGFAGGEHKFLHVTDFDRDGVDDILDGASGATYNKTFFRRNLGDWLAWEAVPIPQPAGVGYYQDVKAADLDLDGDTDLAFSYSHAEGALSGVVALSATAEGGWERVEVSGPDGTKFDNIELHDFDDDGDLDIVTSEQTDQLGLIWYENPAR
jgi:hypothetical protein